ncbi:hypothetical protein Tco_1436992 [Tanacetum coccineum]
MKYSEHKKGKGYRKTSIELPFDPNMFAFEDYSIFDISRDDEDDGAVADINNLDTTIQVSRNPTTRIHKDHPLDQVIGDMQSSFNKQEKFLRIERTWVFPDIMFADVVPVLDTKSNPKVSHLHDVKRIFSLDRKSTTEEAELWLASSCVIVLWIQNQLLDYRKAKKRVRLMMGKLFGMELKLILFWSTVMSKTINGEEQLHALVDGKKIIITESSVRRDLQLADEEGVDCLPNSTIFEQLTLMGLLPGMSLVVLWHLPLSA